MALQRQIVTIPFAQGLDTKTDPKQAAPGKLVTLQNGVFTTAKKIRKRYGTTAKATSILGGGSVAAADTIRAFKDELLLGSSGPLYSWSPGESAWSLKGTVPRFSVSVADGDRGQVGGAVIAYCGLAEDAGIRCLVRNVTAGLVATLSDSATGSIISRVVVDPGTTAHARVAVLNGAFVVAWTDGGLACYYRTVSKAGALGAKTQVYLSVGFNPALDMVASGGKVFFAYTNSGATDIEIKSLDSALALSAATAFGMALAASLTALSIGVDDSNGNLLVCSIKTLTACYLSVMTPALAVVVAKATIEASADLTAQCITSVATDSSGVPRAWYGRTAVDATFGSRHHIRTAALPGYVPGTPTTLVRNAMQCGFPIVLSGVTYTLVYPDDGVNRGRFLLNAITGAVLGRVATSNGAIGVELTQPRILSSGGSLVVPVSVQISAGTFTTGGYSTSAGTAVEVVTFSPLSLPTMGSELAECVTFSSSLPSVYDGYSVAEQGFNHDPGLIKATVSAGGTLAAGLIGFAAIYAWTDSSGAVHRSAPAFASATTSAGNGTVTVIVPTLRITNRSTAATGPVRIVLYRTIANGTVYYENTSTINDPTVDSVTFTEAGTYTDLLLIAEQQLYTTGGVLETVPAPSFAAMTVYRNRIVGISAEDPLQIWYSKQVVPGEPVEFSDFLVLNLDPVGGDATALAALDDKLIIFKAGVAYYITGTGPDSTGGQNDFSVPILINTNSGCTEPRSVVTAADGVMYKSAKGIYLLDRSLQDSYIGYAVEDFNASTITGVVQVPSTNEVRFVLGGGAGILVYDFLVKQWSTFTGLSAVDVTVWDGKVHTVKATGVVSYEDSTTFTDSGTAIQIMVGTGWLGAGDLQSFLRIYKLFVLGEWKSSHTLNVAIGYDYRSDLTAANAYAIAATSDPSPAQFQYRVNLSQQKAEAIQVWIYDTGTTGESLDLSALSFEVGVKSGPMKLAAARNV